MSDIEKIIARANLPKETVFLGYLVCVPNREEILKEHMVNDGITACLWAKTPREAMFFQSKKQALNIISEIDHEDAQVGYGFKLSSNEYWIELD